MTPASVDVQCQLTIPRPLATCFDAPAALKAYLIQHHVWPERVQTERWRLDTIGYVVDLTVTVPAPATQGDMP
jgi:hypothetical protein